MQARYAFRKFGSTDRLQNIRYQQICMHDNIDIHLHFQKKYASSSKPPVLANLYTRRCLIPKLVYVLSLTSGAGKFAYKTGLYFPKYVLLLVFKTSGTGKFARKTGLHFPKYIFFFFFKNLLYRQICMQVYSPYTK